MQRSTKAILDSVLSAVDFVLPEWVRGPICPRIPDFSGIPESESAILDSKDSGVPDLTTISLGSFGIRIILNLVTVTSF